MTPVFCCGFECGVLAATGTQHWIRAGTGAVTIDTTVKISGDRSMKVDMSGSTTRANRFVTLGNAFSATAIFVARFYVQFTTFPTANTGLFSVTLSGQQYGVLFKVSDSKLYPGQGASGALWSEAGGGAGVGVAITTGVWYRIDVRVNCNGGLIDLQVNGNAVAQYNGGLSSLTATNINFGLDNDQVSTTGIAYFDDVIISNTTGDYPIGGGYVNHFVPTSDGTHTATTTTIVKGTIATPVGANVAGSTDVFNWVNGVPLLGGATDNTRLVNQQTAGTTLYAEVVFGPAPGILTPKYGPRAVEVITADREATTATGDFTTKINDNGTESTVIARGVVAGSTSDRYATKQFPTPPTGGVWGVASGAGNFNNLRARFGYASDATPDQYWRGIMVEAEFAEWPQKITQVKQAVNRSNNY